MVECSDHMKVEPLLHPQGSVALLAPSEIRNHKEMALQRGEEPRSAHRQNSVDLD